MNNSTPSISMPNCVIYTDAFKIILTVLYTVLFFTSLLGNILVIVVVYRNKSLRNSANYFIVNMAVSDLFIPILVIPRVIKQMSADHSWEITGLTGEILCKLVYFLSDVTPLVSILSLICISWDRFCAVMFPLTKRNYVPRWLLISSTWLISFIVLAPHFYTFRLQEGPNNKVYCVRSWSPAFDPIKAEKVYATLIIVLFIIIPFFLLSFIYLGICIVMVNQKVIGDRSEKRRAIRDRKTKTVIKLAFTIVLASAICYGPYGILLLLLSFKFEYIPPQSCAWGFWLNVSFILAYSNAAVNPAIYFIYVQNYKKELKSIWHYMSRPFSGNSASGALVGPGGQQQLEMAVL